MSIYVNKCPTVLIKFKISSIVKLVVYVKKSLDIFAQAYEGKFAIPQFNINNFEWTKYILEECNNLKSPVVLGVSPKAAEYMGGYRVVRTIVNGLIHELSMDIPVIVHLDHGTCVDECKKAYEAGFESVMIDASYVDLDQNIKITKEVCSNYSNCVVEAETGLIGNNNNEDNIYTTYEDAKKFVESTYIDLYAPAIGTVHGLYKNEPKIDFNLLKKLNTLKKPMVIHGGTGLTDDILKECVANGVVKVNFNTELQVAWANAVRKYLSENPSVYDPRKIISSGEKALKAVVREKIMVLNSIDKG